MSNTNNIIILVARILLAFMFIFAGFGKLTDPAGTAGMIAGAGMHYATLLTYLAGAFEFVTGVCVLIGFQIRVVGWLLAVFNDGTTTLVLLALVLIYALGAYAARSSKEKFEFFLAQKWSVTVPLRKISF